MSETLRLFAEEETTAPAAVLPAPARERFQPLRAGIFNLWQYDEQEFRFHDGRLILRGENGTGKSKALELLLPFLFDADLSPQRLDPFGGTSRTMEWNLLQDDRYEGRVGYVWLELGRTGAVGGDGGQPLCWTLGAGLRASQRTRRVDSWYFLTRRRVGEGLSLFSPQRTPYLKEQLRQQIGDDGWIFDTGREYREKLDAQLFGLGEDRFATLRHLLLQLRRPHLSEKLDPKTLSELLMESLPALDPHLIGQLSESFERLDNDQKELARTEAAAKGVEGFLELYREYGRGMARGRAAQVRQAESRYHKTAAEMREAEEEGERLSARLDEQTGRERQLDGEIVTSRGTLRALEQSPGMRSAAALSAKREHAASLARQAAQDREDALREGRTIEERRRELAEAVDEARERDREREAHAGLAAAAAREAGLEAVQEAAMAALPERPGAAEATVQAALTRREDEVAQVRRLAGERDEEKKKEERAHERHREADAQARSAAERSLAARGEVESRQELALEALEAWGQGLAELRLDEAALELLRRHILEPPAEGSDFAAAVALAAAPARDALVAERTAAAAALAATEETRRETEEERRRVAEARELGPEPPRTRGADRVDRARRAGAPLYLLTEFADGLPARERAGVEAALEAAGLLDAWILPDGGVLPAGTLDTALVPLAGERRGRTLAHLLVPSPGHGVEGAVIEAVLRSIDLAPEESGESFGVGTGGTFRLGPLAGAWAKPEAEHVGAGAREAARQRKLAELAARLAEIDFELARLAALLEALGGRLEGLRREVEAAPSAAVAELRRARFQAEAALDDERRRQAELTSAGEALAAARAALEAAERRLASRARELGLAGWLDDLAGYRERLRAYAAEFRGFVRAVAAATAATGRAAQAGERFAAATAREAEVRGRAQASGSAAAAAQAEHAELEATVGVEAREVIERHVAESRRLEDLESRRGVLAEEIQVAREERARAGERLRLKQVDLEERDAERGETVARLKKLAEAGFLPLVFPPLLEAQIPEEPPALWSLTRALDLARDIERAGAGVDLAQEAANRRANRLHERFQILAADLGADYQPRLDQDEDLDIVRVRTNGRDHDVPGLLAALHESIEVRRGLLADHERETLRRFLLGDVGNHLRQRLLEAREHVDHINQLLAACRTASGMSLKLAWEPVPEAAPEIKEAVRLLRQDLDLLSDADRRRLETFFQSRIQEARQQWEAVPWREHLLSALDYRAWYRFRILRRGGPNGEWAELTRRGHDASSGGEKAVALHLPLFAAAAAHYRSALSTAPRLILLDEAFAGIDQGMRGRCMALLVAFDLDFMMTSHDEWGCYEELPGVATYQLYRDPTLDGVAAVRFVWNGRGLEEERTQRT